MALICRATAPSSPPSNAQIGESAWCLSSGRALGWVLSGIKVGLAYSRLPTHRPAPLLTLGSRLSTRGSCLRASRALLTAHLLPSSISCEAVVVLASESR